MGVNVDEYEHKARQGNGKTRTYSERLPEGRPDSLVPVDGDDDQHVGGRAVGEDHEELHEATHEVTSQPLAVRVLPHQLGHAAQVHHH